MGKPKGAYEKRRFIRFTLQKGMSWNRSPFWDDDYRPNRRDLWLKVGFEQGSDGQTSTLWQVIASLARLEAVVPRPR